MERKLQFMFKVEDEVKFFKVQATNLKAQKNFNGRLDVSERSKSACFLVTSLIKIFIISQIIHFCGSL
jgi:hypothetical protein